MKQLNKNKVSLFLVMALVMTLVIPSVSARIMQVNITAPATGVILGTNGTIKINASVYNITINDSAFCWFYVQSASTNATAWAQIAANSTNGSNSQAATYNNSVYYELNISKLEDSNDYVFNVTCGQSGTTHTTNISLTNSVTGITIDSSEPTTPSSLSPSASTKDTDGTLNFSATVTDNETTGCTLYFPTKNPGSASYAMTYSGDSCSHQLTSISEESYDYYIQATDESNTTDSATTVFSVDISSGGAAGAAQWYASQSSIQLSEDVSIPTWVIIALAIAVIGIVIVRRK